MTKTYHIQWKFTGHRIETVAKVPARHLRQAIENFCFIEGYRLRSSRVRRVRPKGRPGHSYASFYAVSGGIMIEGFAVLPND